MKNQRFQFWRLSTDYDIICQGWPSPARSSQILAIKKAKLLKLLPPSISYGGPYKKNNKGAPEPTKRCLKNSDSKFFAYLFLLSYRICRGCPILKKKTSNFPKGRDGQHETPYLARRGNVCKQILKDSSQCLSTLGFSLAS